MARVNLILDEKEVELLISVVDFQYLTINPVSVGSDYIEGALKHLSNKLSEQLKYNKEKLREDKQSWQK